MSIHFSLGNHTNLPHNSLDCLALTKEAALIRSILNASMMYLVVKICTNNNHHSCGCLVNPDQDSTAAYPTPPPESQQFDDIPLIQVDNQVNSLNLSEQDLSLSDLIQLNSGSPLRLSRTLIQRQGKITRSYILLHLNA